MIYWLDFIEIHIGLIGALLHVAFTEIEQFCLPTWVTKLTCVLID